MHSTSAMRKKPTSHINFNCSALYKCFHTDDVASVVEEDVLSRVFHQDYLHLVANQLSSKKVVRCGEVWWGVVGFGVVW